MHCVQKLHSTHLSKLTAVLYAKLPVLMMMTSTAILSSRAPPTPNTTNAFPFVDVMHPVQPEQVHDLAQPQCVSVIFLDWDDTVLCSSALMERKLRLDSPVEVVAIHANMLRAFSIAILPVLQFMQRHCSIVIVTNAERGWVQLSCAKFVPDLLPFVESCTVVSARSRFESTVGPNPIDWKKAAFAEQLTVFARRYSLLPAMSCRRQVMSLGDSLAEREALFHSTKDYLHRYGTPITIKSIKFAERPRIEELYRQWALIHQCFAGIYTQSINMDLQLTIQNPPPVVRSSCVSNGTESAAMYHAVDA